MNWGVLTDKFLALLGIISWPIVILIVLVYFREVLAYMFFSMEQFNFFGTTGKIKNVETMIREEANKLKHAEEEEQKIIAERKEHEVEIAEIRDQKITLQERADKATALVERLFDENETLKEMNYRQKVKYRSLRNELAHQRSGSRPELNTRSSPRVVSSSSAEFIDIGSTDTPSESQSSK